MERDPNLQSQQRMLTFRSGGWVILLALLLTVALGLWALWPAMTRERTPVPESPDDYSFDLTELTVPRNELHAELRKDALPGWDDPPLVPEDAIGEQIHFAREKYLVSSDRVIGVTIAGESRAYPITVLNVHEIINDTLAGTPIAVTYHPWCDSAVVFERTVAGETVEFGPSGMLLDSNLVLFDRRDVPADESLFVQLSGRAIAGPAAARDDSLHILPTTLTTWADWHAMHPQTSVIGWDESLIKRYEGSSHDQYFRDEKLAFPVDPLPPDGLLDLKDRVLAVEVRHARRVYPYPVLAQLADADGIVRDTVGETPVEIRYDPDYDTAVLMKPAPRDDVHVIYAMWFAWFAVHGDADVVRHDQGTEGQAEKQNG